MYDDGERALASVTIEAWIIRFSQAKSRRDRIRCGVLTYFPLPPALSVETVLLKLPGMTAAVADEAIAGSTALALCGIPGAAAHLETEPS